MQLVRLFNPDDFKKDPYGYLTNQIGHIYLGFNLMVLYCFIVDKLSHYPNQAIAFGVMVTAYGIGWELIRQGWRGFDTVEDLFYLAWGAGVFLFIDMEWVIDRLFVACVAIALPLFWGASIRMERAANVGRRDPDEAS